MLPLNETTKILGMIIFVRAVFHEKTNIIHKFFSGWMSVSNLQMESKNEFKKLILKIVPVIILMK